MRPLGKWFFWLMLLPPLAGWAAGVDEEVAGLLQGKAFCAPDETFPAPPGWLERSIRYDQWARRADVAVSLDQQIHQLLHPLIKAYAREKGLDIPTLEGNCGLSSGQVMRKQVDIAGYCCPPGRSDRLPGLSYHTLGIASVAILVHPDNPLRNLSLKQARAIFRGQAHYWSQFIDGSGPPGPHWPIQTIGRLHCRLRPGHWRALLKEPDDFSPRMEEVGTISDMLQRILAQRGGIGYETMWHVNHYKGNEKPKALTIDGHAPDEVEALLSGHYPFYHVFNLTLWEGSLTNPHARELVRYLMEAVEKMDPAGSMVSAQALRKAGWRFQGNELIGEPEK
ncbi:MAG: hypothetical protein HQM03_18540 [Magnetococcales bacterium]|nr:hypothetical protein [Magnetococcales bacterium]